MQNFINQMINLTRISNFNGLSRYDRIFHGMSRMIINPKFIKSSTKHLSTNPSSSDTSRAERSRLLSFIYEDNEKNIMDIVKDMNKSGLPPEKNKLFYINLSSHLISNGRIKEGIDLINLTAPTKQLTDDQFMLYLERILTSESIKGDQLKYGELFYTKIIESGFHKKRNRDFIIARFLQHIIRITEEDSNLINIKSLLEYYTRLSSVEPLTITDKERENRQKIHPAAFWSILSYGHKNNSKDINLIYDYIKHNGSSVQYDCYSGLWMLYSGNPLEFIDLLAVDKKKLTGNHIEYLMVIAETCKEPKIIESLLDYPELFKKLEQLVKLCETIALISGKSNDLKHLELLFEKITKIYKSNPEEYHISSFRKTLHRIKHFYRCNNTAPPQALSDVMKRFT